MIEFLIAHKTLFVILHALVAAIGLGSVVVTDTLFFQYLKDFKISPKEEETMRTISRLVWVIIGLLFITGLALYLTAPLDYIAKAKFVVKMVIFVVIVLNGFVLNIWITPVLRKIAFGHVDHQPSRHLRLMRRIAFASGAISLISWFSVFLLGSLRSIPVGVMTGLLVYVGLVSLGIIGSQMYATWTKYGFHLPMKD